MNETKFYVLRDDLGKIIVNNGNLLMGGAFVKKKDNSVRRMGFRRNTDIGVKGTGQKVNSPDTARQIDIGQIKVVDMALLRKGEHPWRTFNVNTALEFNFRGESHTVIDSISEVDPEFPANVLDKTETYMKFPARSKVKS